MKTKKYFWWMNDKAAAEAVKIIKNPQHPMFVYRIFDVLSRSDDAKALFRIISQEEFVEQWPRIRVYWNKKSTAPDYKAWWETIYEQIVKKNHQKVKVKGESSKTLIKIVQTLRDARIEKGLNQSDFARRLGMKQPDISAIEQGRKNITIETLLRLTQALGIKTISL